jgi:hypothetical protein
VAELYIGISITYIVTYITTLHKKIYQICYQMELDRSDSSLGGLPHGCWPSLIAASAAGPPVGGPGRRRRRDCCAQLPPVGLFPSLNFLSLARSRRLHGSLMST